MDSVRHTFEKRIVCHAANEENDTGHFSITYRAHPSFTPEITVDVHFSQEKSDIASIARPAGYLDIVVSHDAIQDAEDRRTHARGEAFIKAYQDALSYARIIRWRAGSGFSMSSIIADIQKDSMDKYLLEMQKNAMETVVQYRE